MVLVVASVAIAGCTAEEPTDQATVKGDIQKGDVDTFTVEENGRTYYCITKQEYSGAGAGAGLWCTPMNETSE